MLRQGGTAADAAVAAALALCVADPANASLLERCHIVLRTREGRFAAIDGASAIPSCLPETLGTGPLVTLRSRACRRGSKDPMQSMAGCRLL
ncbi:gamma-glutamyltransferase [Mesorhizobium delmotii]